MERLSPRGLPPGVKDAQNQRRYERKKRVPASRTFGGRLEERAV
ncbi:MAG: hypothetical protein RLZZ253_3144 [Verrucomicrobiota bacterium]